MRTKYAVPIVASYEWYEIEYEDGHGSSIPLCPPGGDSPEDKFWFAYGNILRLP